MHGYSTLLFSTAQAHYVITTELASSRPIERPGTSGLKASVNEFCNLAMLDRGDEETHIVGLVTTATFACQCAPSGTMLHFTLPCRADCSADPLQCLVQGEPLFVLLETRILPGSVKQHTVKNPYSIKSGIGFLTFECCRIAADPAKAWAWGMQFRRGLQNLKTFPVLRIESASSAFLFKCLSPFSGVVSCDPWI